MRLFVISLCLICGAAFSSATPLKFGLFAKRGVIPISKFSIFSERCSGSNYTQHLISTNLGLECFQLSHKHFPPWFELPMSENFGDSQCYTFEGTEDCLFIILFRNPYDWVRSLHRTPWHGHESFKKSTLDEFITTTWLLNNQKQTNLIRLKNPLMDLNPETGKEFDNILKLRTAKIKNMLLIQKKAENFYYVNYEKIRDNPKEVLDEIASLFNFSLDFTFQPIVYFKGKPEQGLFSKKIDLQLKKSTLDLINSQLDWEVETTIGYQRINEPEQT